MGINSTIIKVYLNPGPYSTEYIKPALLRGGIASTLINRWLRASGFLFCRNKLLKTLNASFTLGGNLLCLNELHLDP
jgi:hypothetical protein